MTNNELIAALKALPAANSAAIRAMPQAELETILQATYDLSNENNHQEWLYIYEAAGGEAAYKAIPYGSEKFSDLIRFGKQKVAARHPEFVELAALVQDLRRSVINRELRRRSMLAMKAANTTYRAAIAVETGAYQVGDKVQVHAFGHWYDGKVLKLGRTGKVTVGYTSGTGTYREKSVGKDKIR
jgi:hypothetical protein